MMYIHRSGHRGVMVEWLHPTLQQVMSQFIAGLSATTKPSCDFLKNHVRYASVRGDHTCEKTSPNMSQSSLKWHLLILSTQWPSLPNNLCQVFSPPIFLNQLFLSQHASLSWMKVRPADWGVREQTVRQGSDWESCSAVGCSTASLELRLGFNTTGWKALSHCILPVRRWTCSSLWIGFFHNSKLSVISVNICMGSSSDKHKRKGGDDTKWSLILCVYNCSTAFYEIT